jgi:hypothetical protein
MRASTQAAQQNFLKIFSGLILPCPDQSGQTHDQAILFLARAARV